MILIRTISWKPILIGSCVVGLVGSIIYFQTSNDVLNHSNQQTRETIIQIKNKIKRLSLNQTDPKAVQKEIDYFTQQHQSFIKTVEQLAASQEILSNNIGNDLVTTEQTTVSKKLLDQINNQPVSNQTIRFAPLTVSSEYKVTYAVLPEYNNKTTFIPIVLLYWQGDKLIYSVQGDYSVATKRISISSVNSTDITYQYYTIDQFGHDTRQSNEKVGEAKP